MHVFHRPPAAPRRAFTLTELAIVLGVLGLILGAIWTAASRVYANNKVSRATNELLAISNNIRQLYYGKTAMGISGDATTQLLSLNVFPSDMIVNGQPVSPWGSPMEIYGSWPDSAHFIVEFDGQDRGRTSIASKYCIPLLLANYKQAAADVSTAIEVTSGGWQPTTVANPTSAFANCTTASFVYSIN